MAKEALESAEKQLNTAQAQVNQAQSGLDIINANSSNGVIVAPVSGTVTSKNINVGEMAVAGANLMSIVNSDKTYINAYLPARLSNEIKQGQKVAIRISEIPDKLFDGKVSLVDTVVDAQNKNILVKVSMLENDPAVKVGMFAEIALKK
ncbi:efflux RND transporter periplasmic adaptor subunit [Aminipila terrae]|uniref:Efflux RND transporter periplasmic adaptor subunit n=1 Tax=Aminipila terrae TaxID=2697030 RepID=A0A6P1MMS5_9FIRM|nr:efflux RND transporter periplasmic adaptor subunit [Aminipila terrae]QHI72966.1 efflux RND transporter periplasmic adaptor subunit [Aminipila terrae]